MRCDCRTRLRGGTASHWKRQRSLAGVGGDNCPSIYTPQVESDPLLLLTTPGASRVQICVGGSQAGRQPVKAFHKTFFFSHAHKNPNHVSYRYTCNTLSIFQNSTVTTSLIVLSYHKYGNDQLVYFA